MWGGKKAVPEDEILNMSLTPLDTYYKKHPTRINSIKILVTAHIKPAYSFVFNK